MRKRVLSAVLALSMLLGLSGCTEPKEESSSDRFFSTQVICIGGESFAAAWVPGYASSFQMEPLNRRCDS